MARSGPAHCQNPQCGRVIAQSGTKGRPRKYCSPSCKNAMVEQRFVERRGRPRDHHRDAEQARRTAEVLLYQPAEVANAITGRGVWVPQDPQIRGRFRTEGDALRPPNSPATRALIDWLRSGAPDLLPDGGGRSGESVGADLRVGSTEWRNAALKRHGFGDPDPAVGTPGWLAANMRR